MFRKAFAAALTALACLFVFAPLAQAQTVTPLNVTPGSGASLCQVKPDGTNLAGCEVKYVWNGSAWVFEPADTSGHPVVAVFNPATTQVYSGQVALTATAAALSTGTWSPSAPTSLTNGLVCKAPQSNAGTVYIGPSGVSTSNGYPLAPGEAISYGPLSTANLYASDTTTTDILVCTGS